MRIRVNFTRWFWLVTLCVFVSGCTTYRQAPLPDAVPEMDSGDDPSPVSVGDTVRIVLHSGDKVSGRIDWMTADEIALGSRGNYGHEDLIIKVSTIDYIEVRKQSDGQIEGGWFGVLVISFLVAAYYGLKNINMN